MPLEVQGPVLPFWNPPVNISLDLDCQGCSSSFSVKKAMLKNGVLFNPQKDGGDQNGTLDFQTLLILFRIKLGI